MAYKDIDEVMAAQRDLVEPLARFEPRLVKMAPSGEPPERLIIAPVAVCRRRGRLRIFALDAVVPHHVISSAAEPSCTACLAFVQPISLETGLRSQGV